MGGGNATKGGGADSTLAAIELEGASAEPLPTRLTTKPTEAAATIKRIGKLRATAACLTKGAGRAYIGRAVHQATVATCCKWLYKITGTRKHHQKHKIIIDRPLGVTRNGVHNNGYSGATQVFSARARRPSPMAGTGIAQTEKGQIWTLWFLGGPKRAKKGGTQTVPD